MAEQKRKKVDTGRAIFDTFLKKKHHETPGRSLDYYTSAIGSVSEVTHSIMDPDRNNHGANTDKMDSITLKETTIHFESLNMKIQQLQEALSDKMEVIASLETENRVLREGRGDHANVSSEESNLKMIKELQLLLDSREIYIKQLSGTLQKRSKELEDSLLREKEVADEMKVLKQEMNARANQSEMKLAELYNELVQNKTKVELLTNQIQKHIEMEQSLRISLENSNRKQHSQQEELVDTSQKLKNYKNETSEEVKNLMRQIEELNHDVCRKEKELINSRKEVELMRTQQEAQVDNKIKALKNQLEKKYEEDVKKVELMYDEMLLKQIRKSDMDLRAIEKFNDLEAQISSYRISYEKDIQKYEINLTNILEKSKLTEEQLLQKLEKHKEEADLYKQQVENVENKLSEEVQKMKHCCELELNRCTAEINAFKENNSREIILYQEEISKLSKQLKEYTLKEATIEVELETYQVKLRSQKEHINSLEENLNTIKKDFKKQKEQLAEREMELNEYRENKMQLEAKLLDYQRNENHLIVQLNNGKIKEQDYEKQIQEYIDKINHNNGQFDEKYNVIVQTFEEEIHNLKSELEINKVNYEKETIDWNSVTNDMKAKIQYLEAKLDAFGISKTCSDGVIGLDWLSNALDSPYDQKGEVNVFKQNFVLAERMGQFNKSFLLNVLTKLREVKAYINTLVHSGVGNISECNKFHEVEENAENLSYEALTQELEKTVNHLLCASQLMHTSFDGNGLFGLPTQESNVNYTLTNMVTSTPNVKDYYKNDYKTTSNVESINCWKKTCMRLENENKKLTDEVELLNANLKEMEYCFIVATKESDSFNKKYLTLDAKVTELEKAKLSEFLLKKENDELKERLAYMEENEEKLHKSQQTLYEDNIKLEQMFNRNLFDLHNKIVKNGTNLELETVLTDLRNKSEEVISLKSQLAKLQESEKKQKLKVLDINSKYTCYVTKHDFLTAELHKKKKELEDIWEERNKLSTENKLLHTKLLSLKNKTNLQALKTNANNNYMTNDGSGQNSEKQMLAPTSFDILGLNRLQTMQMLSATHNLANLSESVPSNLSLVNQIGYQLQLLDQQMGNSMEYYMPTIPEEADVEEDNLSSNQDNEQSQQVHH